MHDCASAESVGFLCRDATDVPIALNASKLSNAWILIKAFAIACCISAVVF